ncbi:putative mitochondrial carrier [Porphyridium purpureum]|uniref:Putative mitochondrial carrier n=1 Tax=Porphyridium purpureum TaxID=35688 RepID=A0A5J4YV30_PORPP|nr:putative mitochondrial carrier [Porphyridium purpureum]|eukprot:POR6206..scf227_4
MDRWMGEEHGRKDAAMESMDSIETGERVRLRERDGMGDVAASVVSGVPVSARERVSVDLLAGAVGGFAADVVVHPIDTVKARLQMQQQAAPSAPLGTPRTPGMPPPPATHAAPMPAMPLYRGLYAGLGAVLLGSVPTHALVFGIFQYTKSSMLTYKPHWFQGPDGESTQRSRALLELACGAGAEVVALSTYVPSEVIAKRMQVAQMQSSAHRHSYASAYQAFRTILRLEGVRGLYAGTLSTAVRDVPFTALQLTCFETLKRLVGVSDANRQGRSSAGSAENAALGFVSGGLAAAVTTPFDMAKTRLQTQVNVPSSSSRSSSSSRRYRGVWHCVRTVFFEEGLRGVFSGLVARVLWVAPASAITLSVYEQIAHRLLVEKEKGG